MIQGLVSFFLPGQNRDDGLTIIERIIHLDVAFRNPLATRRCFVNEVKIRALKRHSRSSFQALAIERGQNADGFG